MRRRKSPLQLKCFGPNGHEREGLIHTQRLKSPLAPLWERGEQPFLSLWEEGNGSFPLFQRGIEGDFEDKLYQSVFVT